MFKPGPCHTKDVKEVIKTAPDGFLHNDQK